MQYLSKPQLTGRKKLHKNINHFSNILRCILAEKRQSSYRLHPNLYSNRKHQTNTNISSYKIHCSALKTKSNLCYTDAPDWKCDQHM